MFYITPDILLKKVGDYLRKFLKRNIDLEKNNHRKIHI